MRESPITGKTFIRSITHRQRQNPLRRHLQQIIRTLHLCQTKTIPRARPGRFFQGIRQLPGRSLHQPNDKPRFFAVVTNLHDQLLEAGLVRILYQTTGYLCAGEKSAKVSEGYRVLLSDTNDVMIFCFSWGLFI